MAQSTSQDLIMDKYRLAAVKTEFNDRDKHEFKVDDNSAEWKKLRSRGKSYTVFSLKMGYIIFDYILEKNGWKDYQIRIKVNKHIIGQKWTVRADIHIYRFLSGSRECSIRALFSDTNNSVVWQLGEFLEGRLFGANTFLSTVLLRSWTSIEPARFSSFHKQTRMTDAILEFYRKNWKPNCDYLYTSKSILAVHSAKFRELFYGDSADHSAITFRIDFMSMGDVKLFLQAIHPPYASSGDYLELLNEWDSSKYDNNEPSVIERVLTLSETLGSSTLRSIAEQTLKNVEHCEKLRVSTIERLLLCCIHDLTLACSEILKSIKPKDVKEIIESEAYNDLSDSVKEYLQRLNPVKKQAPKRRQSAPVSVTPRKSRRLQNKDPIVVNAPRSTRR